MERSHLASFHADRRYASTVLAENRPENPRSVGGKIKANWIMVLLEIVHIRKQTIQGWANIRPILALTFTAMLSIPIQAQSPECRDLLASRRLLKELSGISQMGRPSIPISSGQVIFLGPASGNVDLNVIWEDGVQGTLSVEAPYPMKVLEPPRGDWIKMSCLRFTEAYQVSTEHLTEFDPPDPDLARRKIQALKSEPLRFVQGESLRYRDESGNIRNGFFAGESNGRVEISSQTGAVAVPKDLVFKRVAGRGGNLSFSLDRAGLRVGTPSGLALEFQNAVARWTSRSGFLALNPKEQVRLLQKLVVAFTPWLQRGMKIDRHGVVDTSCLLTEGFGVCRHLTPLLNLLLVETGFKTRTVLSPDHMWVEVLNLGGTKATLVADPNHRTLSTTMELRTRRELETLPKEQITGFIRDQYLNPDRCVANQTVVYF